LPSFFHRLFSKLQFLSAPASFFKRRKRMRGMKMSTVGAWRSMKLSIIGEGV
jgi:hypothetical protein